MGYWLAQQRDGQQSEHMMRFDPRFWTINFPRPMMASVITTGADALRAEAVFYNKDDLAGLIWDSEDRLDHPLLAYETNRDYRRLTLRFHWRSEGIMPLDAINGPTLTIEGKDQSGAARAWYVRLWNYAQGTPTNADIEIIFSQLEGGFDLPTDADPVHAAAIDRMFISVVPPSYDEAGGRHATPQTGWVEISQMRADGAGAVVVLGDIFMPEHGLAMATAYDDSFNQTPARLLRLIRALGYRGLINHYLGMSHYYRLGRAGEDLLVTLEPTLPGEEFTAVNQPCVAWHRDLARRAANMGFEIIWSLSYELFNANCPEVWKQRAENGDPALTGWVPPSTLLSPANAEAMGYLQQVARDFTTIAREAGKVRFQVGEPWWWIMPDQRICLYDDAARAEFGDDLVSIDDIRGDKSPAQQLMLDRAGEMLARSTAELIAAVREEAGAVPVEALLLAYLPTILDREAPEARRANLPVGWAVPAFDILQLEDYDWIIAGDQAATRRGIRLATEDLGYPIDEQHYFAGFVLRDEDRFIWSNMADAIRAAKERGTREIFVWALPQVARDGFTIFDEEEDDVQGFDDVQFPLSISAEAMVMPSFSTSIATSLSGHEQRNSNWSDARLRFDAGPGLRAEADVETLIAFFRARRGPARAFRFADPFDHSSHGMTGSPTATDQFLGSGDGQRSRFGLVKRYEEPAGSEEQLRRISLPQRGSVRVAVDGQVNGNWVLTDAAEIEFQSPPPAGARITAGFLFDVPVRFEDDSLELSRATYRAGQISEIRLIEVRR